MTVVEQFSMSSEPAWLGETVGPVVHRGGIVALPTETFYGLGTDPFDVRAVERLLAIKGRPDNKPILVLIGERAQLTLLVREVSPCAALLMDHFWPGALTIVFPALPSLPLPLTAGTRTVGVRCTSCSPLARLLRAVGPLTGTSANRAGGVPARTAGEVQEALGQDIDLILDAGQTPGGLPSTIVEARDVVRLIREGAVSRQDLHTVLQPRGVTLM